MERSESGSAFFPTFSNGQRSVLKGSSTVVQETFAHEMALHLSIPVPKNLRLISFTSREFHSLKRAMKRVSEGDVVLGMAIERELNRPFFCEMDFIPGNRLGQLIKNRKKTAVSQSGNFFFPLFSLIYFRNISFFLPEVIFLCFKRMFVTLFRT